MSRGSPEESTEASASGASQCLHEIPAKLLHPFGSEHTFIKGNFVL